MFYSIFWIVATLSTILLVTILTRWLVSSILYRALELPMHTSSGELLPHASRSHRASYRVVNSATLGVILVGVISGVVFVFLMSDTLLWFVCAVVSSLLCGLVVTVLAIVSAVKSPQQFLALMGDIDG